MNDMSNIDIAASFFDAAYKFKPSDLESLLQKIELEIKNSDYADKSLLRAKTVVTSKLALYYSK